MNRYAVVDLETTGFGPKDRVIEIGLVLVDGNQIIQEWETLVNPERDISNSAIHGITSDTVSLAPIFAEMADDVGAMLDGRIFVAHNVHFDSRMLIQEFNRLGRELEISARFCTLQATKLKLTEACKKYGIVNLTTHRALTDARATAMLLIQLSKENESSEVVQVQPPRIRLPARTLSRAALSDEHSAGIQTLHRRIPDFNDSGYTGSQLSYFAALFSIMSDFKITAEEAEYLREWAEAMGVSKEEQDAAHQDYLHQIVEAANRDGYLSESEQGLIKKAAQTLGILPPLFVGSDSNIDHLPLSAGIKICFTGSATSQSGEPISRADLEAIAITKGYVPVTSVTKKSCDLLVAENKSSMSGKTQKARNFGIRVISVKEFLND